MVMEIGDLADDRSAIEPFRVALQLKLRGCRPAPDTQVRTRA